MYNIRELKQALRLLSKYDYAYTKVSRELGIPITTLRMWRNKDTDNIPLLIKTRNKKRKWSENEVDAILDYYFEHGKNAQKTAMKFGYPAYSTFISWVHADKRFKKILFTLLIPEYIILI